MKVDLNLVGVALIVLLLFLRIIFSVEGSRSENKIRR